jgi:hypothetical protein
VTDLPADPRDERQVAAKLDVRFEREDVAAGVVARWAVGLVVMSVVVAALAVWLLVFLRRSEEGRDPERPALYFSSEARQPEGVRLQASPFTDLHALQEQERQILGSYGWVDPAAGTVRIPIEEAMKLYVARQSPGRGAATAASTGPTDSAPVPPPRATAATPLPAAAPSPAASGPPAPPPPHGPGPAGAHR